MKIGCYFDENDKSDKQNEAAKEDSTRDDGNNEAVDETSSTYHFEDDFDVSDHNIDASQQQKDTSQPERVNSEAPSRYEDANQNADQDIKPVLQLKPPETKPAFQIGSQELKPVLNAINERTNDNRASVSRYNPISRSNQQQPETKNQSAKQNEDDKVSNIYIMPIETHLNETDKKNGPVEEYTVIQQRDIDLDRKDQSLTRVCRLIRTTNNELYGFDLKTFPADGRHIAKNIVQDSPAHRAGLIDGDIILEINGDSADGLDKNQVISLIKKYPRQVELLVIYYKNIGRLNEVGARPPLPTIKPREIPRYRKNSAFSAVDKRARAASAIINPTGL